MVYTSLLSRVFNPKTFFFIRQPFFSLCLYPLPFLNLQPLTYSSFLPSLKEATPTASSSIFTLPFRCTVQPLHLLTRRVRGLEGRCSFFLQRERLNSSRLWLPTEIKGEKSKAYLPTAFPFPLTPYPKGVRGKGKRKGGRKISFGSYAPQVQGENEARGLGESKSKGVRKGGQSIYPSSF